ncbi:MAG: hypothetical protein A4S09_11815 [Proteobacteria bacterium SG_bin7]|nr:MAG: hypothetical protein A4S09_11815 [Proteobacteria bacterium SG_bin7]
MKKVLAITALTALTMIVACKKDDPVNLNNPNLISPFNCTPGNVITPQGTFPQGNCPFGQGQNQSNQCVTGTPCQGVGSFGNGSIVSYYNSLNVVSKSVFENLMGDGFFVCQKNNAWGMSNCDYYSDNLELIIESYLPTNGVMTSGMQNTYATIYAGAPRMPLVSQMIWLPINNNTGNNTGGFELKSSSAPGYSIRVESGNIGQDSFKVRVIYKGTEFANGFVSRYR